MARTFTLLLCGLAAAIDGEQDGYTFYGSMRRIVMTFGSGRHRKHIAGADVMLFAGHNGLSAAWDENRTWSTSS